MSELVVNVSGMTCDACARSVTKALARVPGVAQVDVDLPTGNVRIAHGEGFPGLPAVHAALDLAGYDLGRAS